MNSFIKNESYKHKCAKEVFRDWCNAHNSFETNFMRGEEHIKLSWSVENRDDAAILEYPICVTKRYNTICELWDECYPGFDEESGDGSRGTPKTGKDERTEDELRRDYGLIEQYYKSRYDSDYVCNKDTENALSYNTIRKNTRYPKSSGYWNGFVPTYEECKKYNLPIVAVIDVVIIHKYNPRYFIEICHKNPVSDEKIEKLKKLGMTNLIEIDAEWILRQVDRPKKLKIKRWLI